MISLVDSFEVWLSHDILIHIIIKMHTHKLVVSMSIVDKVQNSHLLGWIQECTSLLYEACLLFLHTAHIIHNSPNLIRIELETIIILLTLRVFYCYNHTNTILKFV